ncbi:cell division control protein 45, partial [Tremellales sp. Uapishka_1]
DVGRGDDDGRGEKQETGGEAGDKKKEQSWYVANFWIAFDACEDISILVKSFPLAMSLHRAIIRQGSSLLGKTAIRSTRTFRLAIMKEGPDLRLFCHPATISRLALWLVDATRDRWAARQKGANANKSLPFVVACLNEQSDTFLVVGVTGAPEFGDVRKNKFGLAFQAAAEESGAGVKHDLFDTSIVEVRKEDLASFIESLQLRSI